MGPDRPAARLLLRGLGIVVAGTAVIAIAAACGSDDEPDPIVFPSYDAAPPDDPTDDAGIGDAGPDARRDAGCANVCDGTCCADDEACVQNDAGKGSCVATCATGKDCATGCCAPATNAKGDPVGPYVCKPNDGQDYACCNGFFTSCKGRGCCVVDFVSQNQYCAVPCTTNAQCGEAHCGRASFGATSTTCTGSSACRP